MTSQSHIRTGGPRPAQALVLAACLLPLVSIPSARAVSGSLDPSFGVGGKVTTAIGDFAGASALALQPDGKLVAAGVSTPGERPRFHTHAPVSRTQSGTAPRVSHELQLGRVRM